MVLHTITYKFKKVYEHLSNFLLRRCGSILWNQRMFHIDVTPKNQKSPKLMYQIFDSFFIRYGYFLFLFLFALGLGFSFSFWFNESLLDSNLINCLTCPITSYNFDVFVEKCIKYLLLKYDCWMPSHFEMKSIYYNFCNKRMQKDNIS